MGAVLLYVLMWGSRNSIELAAEAVHKLRRLASEAPVHLRPFQERAFGGPDEGKRVGDVFKWTQQTQPMCS